MLQRLLIFFYVFSWCIYLCFCNNDIKYCVVDWNSTGITEKKMGIGSLYRASTALNTTVEIEFKSTNTPENWNFGCCPSNICEESEIEQSFERCEQFGPVIDERWEKFAITEKLQADTYWSVKRVPGENITVFKDCEENEWCHIFVSNSSYKEWTQDKTPASQDNTVKYHTYNFITTDIANVTEIYVNQTQSRSVSLPLGCLIFYVSVCRGCEIEINIKDIKEKEIFYNQMENLFWQKRSFCISDFPRNYTLQITTRAANATNEPFWAIGDLISLSKCKNGYRVLELSSSQECINANNEVIHSSAVLPECFIENHVAEEITEPTPFTTLIIKTNSNAKGAEFNWFYLLIIIPAALIIVTIYFVYNKFCKNDNKRITDKVTPSDKEKLVEETPLVSIQTRKPPPVKVKDFETYVQDALLRRVQEIDLERHFLALSVDFSRSYAVGRQNDNKNKNSMYVPYDDNRVELQPVLDDNTFANNYINASYIKGGLESHEYIVAQNPLESTQLDFWHMIWQEQIEYIVMITGRSLKNYTQYWPDINQQQQYGSIVVESVGQKEYEYFDYRQFTVTRYGLKRELNQYHFTFWMDSQNSNELMFSHTLVDFVQELLKIPHGSNPILVHNEEGVGSVGTVILCDMALRLIPSNNSIDLYQIATEILNSRAYIIQTLDQYKLAHLIILESLLMDNKEIFTNVSGDFQYKLQTIITDEKKLMSRWDYLNKLKWIDEGLNAFTVCPAKTVEMQKNRYNSALPMKHSCVTLCHIEPSYINATRVDGYRAPNKFIVTQFPLERTLTDFWIMVLQNNTTVIVNLNDIYTEKTSYAQIWPLNINEYLRPMPDVEIKCTQKEEQLYLETYFLELFEKGKKRMNITVVNMKDWEKDSEIPESVDALIDVWKAMCKVPGKIPSRILVVSDDGLRATGLLVSLDYLLNKIISEEKCDVSGAIRAIRRSHNSFITYEQFVFLYKCIERYNIQF